MAVQGISWSGVVVRLVLALLLVLATYNPTGYSFYHWISALPTGITAVKAFASVLLAIGWIVCLRTAYVALGMLGVVLVVALRRRLRSRASGDPAVDGLVGELAVPREDLAPGATGSADLRGAPWTAINYSGTALRGGQRCRVSRAENLTIFIRPE